jgi:hypothetical protein
MILYLLLALITPAENHALKWKFAKGDTFTMETVSQLKQTVKVNGQDIKQDLSHITRVKYTVTDLGADGIIALDQEVESMKAANPDGSPSAGNNAILNQLQGSILKAKLAPDLKVKELEGYEEIIKRLAGDDPSLRRVVQALLSEEQLKQAIQHSFSFVPQKETADGETWKRDLKLNLGTLGSITTELNFKLAGKATIDGKELVKIEYQPTIKYAPPSAEAANPELSILSGNINLKSGKGVAYFDAKAGRLHSSQLTLELAGDMKAKLSGKEIPLTFEQTQTIEVRMKK